MSLRWMVRLERSRDARFGDAPLRLVQWGVTPYLARTRDGRLVGGFQPRLFPSLTAAHAYARREQHRIHARAIARATRPDPRPNQSEGTPS